MDLVAYKMNSGLLFRTQQVRYLRDAAALDRQCRTRVLRKIKIDMKKPLLGVCDFVVPLEVEEISPWLVLGKSGKCVRNKILIKGIISSYPYIIC